MREMKTPGRFHWENAETQAVTTATFAAALVEKTRDFAL